MTRPAPSPPPRIRELPASTVNRIAAGEVIERPASAIKELVENALDAGATRIDVAIEAGGLSLIRIEDDGHGMDRGGLALALRRHATSKLPDDGEGGADLLDIRTMGFRGEALPSIASVSRFSLLSRPAGAETAHIIRSDGSGAGAPEPAAWTGRGAGGTVAEVRDLFFATPARLAFMRTPRSETMAAADAVRRLAMARPDAAFRFAADGRQHFSRRAEAPLERLAALMGRDFGENAVAVDLARGPARVSGHAGLPTLNRGNAAKQFLFVNGRPVKDRLLSGVVRAAYADHLARDRHPLVALFIDIEPHAVDVNVHPAKTEVRFRDAADMRGLLITALRQAIEAAGHRASTTVSGYALSRMRAEQAPGAGAGAGAQAGNGAAMPGAFGLQGQTPLTDALLGRGGGSWGPWASIPARRSLARAARALSRQRRARPRRAGRAARRSA